MAHRGSPDCLRWGAEGLDGDGRWCCLCFHDKVGDFLASPYHPRLMLPRWVEGPPPYCRLYPEGIIEHRDSETIVRPEALVTALPNQQPPSP